MRLARPARTPCTGSRSAPRTRAVAADHFNPAASVPTIMARPSWPGLSGGRVARRPENAAQICLIAVTAGELQTLPGWPPVALQMAAVRWFAVPIIDCATRLCGFFRSWAIWDQVRP